MTTAVLNGTVSWDFYSGFLLALFSLCRFLVAVCAHISWFYTVDWWQASDVKGGNPLTMYAKCRHVGRIIYLKKLSLKNRVTLFH